MPRNKHRQPLRFVLLALLMTTTWHAVVSYGEPPRVLPVGQSPADRRYEALRGVNSYHPFRPVASPEQWQQRSAELRRQLLVASGLWPLPVATPLKAVIHGRVGRDDYTVERVFFESTPGDFVTGSLYRPKHPPGEKIPGVLCPHGHWNNGRFYENSEAGALNEIANGAERFVAGGRYPLQARCVQLARMGCIVFHYDMLGNADSIQLGFHRPSYRQHLNNGQLGGWGFMSPQADARLQTVFGLQTLHSFRAVDFLRSLPDVDPERIAVTGASGGGTQSMILGALDERVAASFPAVMVSTAMQGGCTCENTHYLRVGAGNIDIAALTAPRPLGLTAADDWTIELKTKGYPELAALYKMLGHSDRLTALFATQFKHNYNHVSRAAMYNFINKHFKLGHQEPVLERDFTPLSREEMTVWTAEYPAPKVRGELFERRLLRQMTESSDAQIAALAPTDEKSLARYREVVGGAVAAMIGRRLPAARDVEFELVDKRQQEGYLLMTGLVRNVPQQEALPTLFLHPTDWKGRVVLWVSPQGKSGVYAASGELLAPVRRLIEAGTSVVAADLFAQGEFITAELPGDRNRMIGYPSDGDWAKFSGYTYGYNHSLFAQRVHDLLTLTTFIRNHDKGAKELAMVGVQGAGPWVAFARAIAGGAIGRAAIDTGGFRFAALTAADDTNFLPGGAKYGDLPGVLALCAPHPLWIVGESKDSTSILARAYLADASKQSLTVYDGPAETVSQAAVEWLLRGTTGR